MIIQRLAQVGFNWNDTNPKNFIFRDDLVSYSIRMATNVTLTTALGSGRGTATLTHNFGYAPKVFIWTTTSSATGGFADYIRLPVVWLNGPANKGGEYYQETLGFHITPTQLIIEAEILDITPGVQTVGMQNTYSFDVLLCMERIDA